MSRLDELIKEYCPEGVEQKLLGEIATISRGGSLQKKDFVEEGFPCIHYGQIYTKYGLFTNKTFTFVSEEVASHQRKAEHGDIIMAVTSENMEDICKCVAWLGDGEVAVSGHTAIIHHKQEPKYLAYFFHSSAFFTQKQKLAHGTKVMEVTPDTLKGIRIPVPPIEVQREIVRILDNFTELTAELTTELTARKKQYEYYRDQLLSFGKIGGVEPPRVKLGEIATDIFRGAGIKRDEVTEEGIPCVRYGEIYTTYNTWFDTCVSHTKLEYVPSPKYFEHGDILFAITGESVEDIAKSVAYIGHDRCLAGGDIVVMKHKQNPRYLAHVLSTTYAREQKSKGKVKSKVVHSNVPSIENIEIPLPPLDVQERMANVLDNFEQICNDLNIGLPAEIEARNKQYEYYRDLLLNFDRSQTVNVERERERAGARRADEIKLLQYVFGFADVRLAEMFDTRNGYTPSKSNPTYWEGNTCIPWFRMEDIRENGRILNDATQHVTPEAVKGCPFPANSFIVATSATIGEHALITVPSLANQRFTYLMCKPEYAALIDTRYVFYYCFKLDEYCKEHLNQGNFSSVDMSKFGEFIFSLPTVDRQKEIAAVLGRFDTLCNDISDGIPAEIEARQKQYEYYRDKILSFNKVEV